MPFADYNDIVKPLAYKYDLRFIMLITPETSEERIRLIDKSTDGFIYMVSSASTTGSKDKFDENTLNYFNSVNSMRLHNPRMVGFGISNAQTLNAAYENASGAIIGSKFVSLLDECNGNTNQALDKLFEALKK